jgi:hypothetical protein
VETASPFSQTAAILEVVAPLSVPRKIFSLMVAHQVADAGGKRKNYPRFQFMLFAKINFQKGGRCAAGDRGKPAGVPHILEN